MAGRLVLDPDPTAFSSHPRDVGASDTDRSRRLRPPLAHSNLVVELVALLRTGGADLEPTVLELLEHDDCVRVVLDRAHADLLERLHDRSDDFAATKALQSVHAAVARLDPTGDPSEAGWGVHIPTSMVARTRIWLRARIKNRRRAWVRPNAPDNARPLRAAPAR
jgi:hypothetical protein